MEKKMNARLVSLNILTHELYGRNYRLFGEQTADDYTFEKRMHRFIALLDYAKPDVVMLQELSGPKYWGTVLDLEPIDESKALYTSKHFSRLRVGKQRQPFSWNGRKRIYGS